MAALEWRGDVLWLGELLLGHLRPAREDLEESAALFIHGLPVHTVKSQGSYDATNAHARTLGLERVQEALFDAGIHGY